MFSEPAPPVQPNIQQDVRLIVSGNFSEDALGPDNYRAVLARLAAAPREYLEAFRAFVRERSDPNRLSSLHLPWFLTLLARTDPDGARDGARELLTMYDNAAREAGGPELGAQPEAAARLERAPAPPETEHDKHIDRLVSRAAELRQLLKP